MAERSIVIVDHARDRMAERGVTEEDVRRALKEGAVSRAEKGRMCAEIVVDYAGDWQNRYYHQKKVQAIYVEENDETVVITVYGFYGSWD